MISCWLWSNYLTNLFSFQLQSHVNSPKSAASEELGQSEVEITVYRMRSHDSARTLSWSSDWTLKSNRVDRFGCHVVVRATRLQRRARADISWCFTKATSFCIGLSQPESKIYLLSQNTLVLENRRVWRREADLTRWHDSDDALRV